MTVRHDFARRDPQARRMQDREEQPELQGAWDQLHAANEAMHWTIGRPGQYDEAKPDEWQLYAADRRRRIRKGTRTLEWTAVAESEADVVLAMALALRQVREDGVPASSPG